MVYERLRFFKIVSQSRIPWVEKTGRHPLKGIFIFNVRKKTFKKARKRSKYLRREGWWNYNELYILHSSPRITLWIGHHSTSLPRPSTIKLFSKILNDTDFRTLKARQIFKLFTTNYFKSWRVQSSHKAEIEISSLQLATKYKKR